MKKGCKGQRLSFPDKYLALTISLLLSFVFASAQTPITYTPMTAAGYQDKYHKSDSGFATPFIDTTLGRGTTRPGSLVTKSSDSLLYFWNGRKWLNLGASTGGGGTGFVDSVTVSGNQIFYWIAGTGYGKQLNKVDSNKIRNDSLFYVIAGTEHYAGKTSGGIDSLHISRDSAFTCKSGVCTFKFLIDSTIVYTDYTIDVDTTANPGFQTLKVHRASLDSIVHRFVDTGVYIPNNYVLAYDSINHKWHPVNLPTYPGFSLTGYNVDNTDPTHPVILATQVDGVSITGTGVVGNPFVATQIDTTNKFVNNVTYENDSTLRIWKGSGTSVVRTGPGTSGGGGGGSLSKAYTPLVISSAGDSISQRFNVMAYGAVHNGVTDDRAAIQAAINAAYTAGGGTVFFPNGKYLIHGALVTSGTNIGNPNAQLYFKIEASPFASGSISIKLLGETPPAPNASSLANYTINKTGVILYSDITGSGTYPSIIGSDSSTVGGFSLVTLTIENINFRVKANIGASGPTMSAMNLSKIAFANVLNVVCDIDTSSNLSVYPTAETFGIYFPKGNNGAWSSVNNMLVTGYKYGYIFNEHSTGNNISASVCEYAFVCANAAHSLYFGRLLAQWCKYGLSQVVGTIPGYMSQPVHIKISEFDLEWQGALGNWYDSRYTVYDSSNYLRGNLQYVMTQRGIGFDNSGFTKLGGTGLQTNPIEFDAVPSSWTKAGNVITYGDFLGSTNLTSLRFRTNNTERAKIDSLGNVTFDGTNFNWSAVNHNLTINNPTNTSASSLNFNNDASINGSLAMYGSLNGVTGFRNNIALAGQNSVILYSDELVASGGLHSLQFMTGGYGSGQERMRIFSNGNIGVGQVTDSLSAKLIVNGNGVINTLYGNTTTGANLTLSSTTHATKGKILFGTSAYDEVNNRLGIGTASPASGYDVDISKSVATMVGIHIKNASTAAGGGAGMIFENSATSAQFFKESTGYGGYKNIAASDFQVYNGTAGNIAFLNDNTTGNINFASGGHSAADFTITSAGGFTIPATNTATGTTGAQTINKPAGKVNFAAAATTLVVTNSLVTTASIVRVQVEGTDATATSARVTLAAGSFTITLNAAATAETKVDFEVIN